MSDELPAIVFIEHLARHLGLSTRTLERRIARGLSMPRELRRIGARRRWAREDVLAWLTRDDEQPKARPHLRAHLRRSA